MSGPMVTVFHNIATDPQGRSVGMLDGYQVGHPLVPVATYPHETSSDLPEVICDAAFRLFNVGDDPERGTPDPRAVLYRARGNRSMSKGDVVRIDRATSRVWFACASFGWVEIAEPQWFAVDATRYGTTPLDVLSSDWQEDLLTAAETFQRALDRVPHHVAHFAVEDARRYVIVLMNSLRRSIGRA